MHGIARHFFCVGRQGYWNLERIDFVQVDILTFCYHAIIFRHHHCFSGSSSCNSWTIQIYNRIIIMLPHSPYLVVTINLHTICVLTIIMQARPLHGIPPPTPLPSLLCIFLFPLRKLWSFLSKVVKNGLHEI